MWGTISAATDKRLRYECGLSNFRSFRDISSLRGVRGASICGEETTVQQRDIEIHLTHYVGIINITRPTINN